MYADNGVRLRLAFLSSGAIYILWSISHLRDSQTFRKVEVEHLELGSDVKQPIRDRELILLYLTWLSRWFLVGCY